MRTAEFQKLLGQLAGLDVSQSLAALRVLP